MSEHTKYAAVGHAVGVTEERRPIDLALDVFLYAPVGASLEMWDRVPGLAEAGRKRLAAQAPTAKLVGRFAVSAGLSKLEDRFGSFAARGRQAASADDGAVAQPPDFDEPSPLLAGPRAATAQQDTTAEGVAAAKAPTVEVAIGGYDGLKAIEIVALLATLSADQRETVRMRELSGRARRTILAKLDRMDSTETDSGR